MFMKFLEISGKILLMNKVFSILIKRYFDFGNDIIFLLNGCKICIISPSILSGLFMSLSPKSIPAAAAAASSTTTTSNGMTSISAQINSIQP